MPDLRIFDGSKIDIYNTDNTSKGTISMVGSALKLQGQSNNILISSGNNLTFESNATIGGQNSIITLGNSGDTIALDSSGVTYRLGTINNHSDVLISSPSDGQLLYWSGGKIVNSNTSQVAILNKEFPTLQIDHPTGGGKSGIVFNSRVNSGSDKAFILYQDNSSMVVSGGTEASRLVIGVYNDIANSGTNDELWLQGGQRLVYNSGTWDSELNSIIGTQTSPSNITHEWRINNSKLMALDSNGLSIEKNDSSTRHLILKSTNGSAVGIRLDRTAPTYHSFEIVNEAGAFKIKADRGTGTYNDVLFINSTDNELWVVQSGTSYKVWHQNNDGSGSGLDADKLDGLDSSAFALAGHNHDSAYASASHTHNSITYTDTRATNINPFDYKGVSFHLKNNGVDSLTDGGSYHGVLHLTQWLDSSGGRVHQLGFTDNKNIYFRQHDGTNWTTWSKIWHSDNDGHGSGLDADTLDGKEASYFAPSNHSHDFDKYEYWTAGVGTNSVNIASKGILKFNAQNNITISLNSNEITIDGTHTHPNDHVPGSDNQNVFTKLHALNSSGSDVANSPYTAQNQNDSIKLKAGTNITLSMNSNTITIDGTHDHDSVYAKKAGDSFTGPVSMSNLLTFGSGQNIAPDSVSGTAPTQGIKFSDDTDVYYLFMRADNVGEKTGLIMQLGDNTDDYFQIEQVSPAGEATPTKLLKVSESEGTNIFTTLYTEQPITSKFTSNSYTFTNLVSYQNWSSNVTGTIKITMPVTWNNTMLRIKIVGYDYSSKAGWELIVSGYNYATTPGWQNYSAEVRGDAPFSQVRLGHDGSKCCLLIGTTSTVWQYPNIVVKEVIASSTSSLTSWGSGWSASLITNESGITNIVTPTIRKTWHSENDGSGSGLDADTVDGYHAGNDSNQVALSNGTVCSTLNADLLDGLHANVLGERYEIEVGSSNGQRRWVRLATLDGIDSSIGANLEFILSGVGDYGNANRGIIFVQAGQRNTTINVKAYGINFENTQDIIELYYKDLGSYKFEIWAKFADYNFTQYMTVLSKKNATINIDNIGTTAPTGVTSVTINKIWHADNDGSGSGLDADLLDGQHASAFALAGHNHDSSYSPIGHDHNKFTKLHALNSSGTDVAGSPYTAANPSDAIKLKAGTNITLSMSSNVVTIDAAHNHDGVYAPNHTHATLTINTDSDTNNVAGGSYNTSSNVTVKMFKPDQNINTTSAPQFTRLGIGGTADSTYQLKLTNGTILSGVSDSSSAIGFTLNTQSLSTAGAKIISLRNNGSEKAYVDKDGNVSTAGIILSNRNKWQLAYSSVTLATTSMAPTPYDFLNGTIDNSFTLVDDTNNFDSILKSADYYIARLHTNVYCSSSKTISLPGMYADDTWAIYVNGKFIDSSTASCQTKDVSFTIPAGFSTIDIYFYEHGGAQYLRWTGAGAQKISDQVDYMFVENTFAPVLINSQPKMVAARITFGIGKSSATWTHNRNWSDYIVLLSTNSPEPHVYYSNKTSNSITINLDDEAYEQVIVDVMLVRLESITSITA